MDLVGKISSVLQTAPSALTAFNSKLTWIDQLKSSNRLFVKFLSVVCCVRRQDMCRPWGQPFPSFRGKLCFCSSVIWKWENIFQVDIVYWQTMLHFSKVEGLQLLSIAWILCQCIDLLSKLHRSFRRELHSSKMEYPDFFLTWNWKLSLYASGVSWTYRSFVKIRSGEHIVSITFKSSFMRLAEC